MRKKPEDKIQELKSMWRKRGLILREIRKRRGLSQANVTEELGISEGLYSKYYENGNGPIPDDKIYALCNLLRTTPNILLGYETIRVTDITVAKDILKDANIRFTDNGKQIVIPVNQFDESKDFGKSFSGILFSDKKKAELRESNFIIDYDDLSSCVNSAQIQASSEMRSVYEALFLIKFKSRLYEKMEFEALNEELKKYEEWRPLLSRKENENAEG